MSDEPETREVYVWFVNDAYEMRDGRMYEHATIQDARADKPLMEQRPDDATGRLYKLTIEGFGIVASEPTSYRV